MSNLNTTKLAAVLALAGSDQDGEALAALRKAQGMLKAAGMSFTDVAERVKAPTAPPSAPAPTSAPAGPSFTDIFAGFDDHMEAKEPGYKARKAAERAERDRQRAAYRKTVLEAYGSEEAALAPCWREQRLRAALGSLVVNQDEPYARWSHHIDGLSHCSDFFGFENVSAEVRAAIEGAFPLPTTIVEAHAEYEAWREREREMEAALNWHTGDTALDLVGYARMERVRMLLETELPARDFTDLLFRSRYCRALEFRCDKIEGAIHRDLERLALAAPRARPVQSEQPRTATERRRAVLDLLSEPDTAALSDREIGRRIGVSPSTVGALRRKLAEQVQGDLFSEAAE